MHSVLKYFQINSLAKWLAEVMDKLALETLYEDGPIKDQYEVLRKKHSTEDKPFLFQVGMYVVYWDRAGYKLLPQHAAILYLHTCNMCE